MEPPRTPLRSQDPAGPPTTARRRSLRIRGFSLDLGPHGHLLAQHILEATTIGVFILDADFHVLWVNSSLERFFGLRRARIIGQDKRLLIHERIRLIFEDPDGFTRRVLATYEDNSYVECFECHVLPKGRRQERWLEHNSYPITEGPHAGGRIELYYDITERKRAEAELTILRCGLEAHVHKRTEGLRDVIRRLNDEIAEHRRTEQALRESRQHVRALIEATQAVVYLKDAYGRYLEVNESFLRSCGLRKEQVLGRTDHDLFPDEQADAFRRNDEKVLSRGRPLECEEDSWDGTRRTTFLSIKFPVRNEAGVAYATGGISVDVSEPKRITDQLAANEARLRAITENATDVIAELDPAGRFVYVTKNCEEATGYSQEKLLGSKIVELIDPDDLEACRAWWDAGNGATAPGQVTARIRHRDGSVRWMEGMGRRYSTGTGSENMVVIFRDVTRRRRLEDQLRRAQHLASLGTLAAGIAHEINNPANAILTAAQFALMIEGGPEARGELRSSLESIVAEAERCGLIVRNVLDFARQESGERWPVDLNQVAASAVERVEARARERSVGIDAALNQDLPRPTLNPLDIEQVLVNLLHNAVDASPQGGRVQLRTALEGERIHLIIRDDGYGMTPQVQARIFEPFFTTRAAEGGVGLGLSLVHGILRSHGAAIEVESAPNQGTEVRILFGVDG
ncbi:MAG: PAS domain S-box protein [Myxococcota bacterium]